MYGAPVLQQSTVYQRGDYLLTESRRIVPGNAVRRPARGSAVSTASILVASNLEVPPFIADQAAAELLGAQG